MVGNRTQYYLRLYAHSFIQTLLMPSREPPRHRHKGEKDTPMSWSVQTRRDQSWNEQWLSREVSPSQGSTRHVGKPQGNVSMEPIGHRRAHSRPFQEPRVDTVLVCREGNQSITWLSHFCTAVCGVLFLPCTISPQGSEGRVHPRASKETKLPAEKPGGVWDAGWHRQDRSASSCWYYGYVEQAGSFWCWKLVLCIAECLAAAWLSILYVQSPLPVSQGLVMQNVPRHYPLESVSRTTGMMG